MGQSPDAVAVNPATNKIYVANYSGNTVTVVDGVTNGTTTVAVGTGPGAVAVNPVTNRIYVANSGSGNVTVIDGATNATTTIAAGSQPKDVAVNPITNRIYVVNQAANSVTAIDGSANTTATINVGTSPVAVAVNPVTNQVYVANSGSANVTVIDGATGSTSFVATGAGPRGLAVNPATNKIYVANFNGGSVTVIDGATNGTATVAAGSQPIRVAVNTVTNRIYAVNYNSANVTVIDGASNGTTTVGVGATPDFVAVNESANLIYVVNVTYSSVSTIDGASKVSTQTVGKFPVAAAVNPVTSRIYVANNGDDSLTVIDGFNYFARPTAVATFSTSVAVNPITNRLYFASASNNTVTVIDGAANAAIATVTAGGSPGAIAVNPATNKIYVANGGYFNSPNSGSVMVIDGATNGSVTLPIASPSSIAVNPVTNKIYVVAAGGVTVIDGASNATASVVTGSNPALVVVNPATNKVYVTNSGGSSVTIIDGAVNNTATVTVGSGPYFAVVNSITNKIYISYVQNDTISVIDGASNAVTNVAVVGKSRFHAMAVNEATNRIYVTSEDSSQVAVIDGAANTTQAIPVSGAPFVLGVNQAANKIYVCNRGTSFSLIDGVANREASREFLVRVFPQAVAVNAATGLGYIAVSPQNSLGLFVIGATPSQSVPPTVSIAPLSGNQTGNPDQPFTFTASSSTMAPPHAVFYQLDTWQGTWSLATGSNPTFSGAVSNVLPGMHVLYAYAADGREASATQAGSPATGAIQAYVFLVTKNFALATQTISFPAIPSQQAGTSVNLAATASSGLPVTFSSSTPVVCAVNPSAASFFAAGICTITASQAGDATYAAAAPVTQNVTVIAPGSTSFVAGQSLGPLRNNYSGFVGMALQVGGTAVVVNSLGRFAAPGNSQTHLLKLVQANQTDVPNGSVMVSMAGAASGTYQYAALSSPVTLQANTAYYLVSQETNGGDQWYDYGPVTTTAAANVVGPVYTDGGGHYVTVGASGYSYVPLSFQYGGMATVSATITSPQNGATVSGNSVPVTVSTTRNAASLQLQVDGVNQGVPVAAPGPLTLDTTVLSNGPHTLTVVVVGGGTSAVSPGVTVTVSNGGPAVGTAFVTGQTASSLRNNYSGFVGMSIHVGASPLTVTQLGRLASSGNSGGHLVKLVQANGTDVAGGSVTVSTAGATAGTYVYGSLGSSVVLAANTDYFLVSQETAGGDYWYDYEPVTATGAATVNGPTYTDGRGQFVVVGAPGSSYVPVNLIYQ